MIELACRFLHLLPQKIKRGEPFSSVLLSVKFNVIANGVCRPECINASWRQQIFRHDALKQFLRIIEKFARLIADLRVIENRRVTTTHLPRMKERRPIDVSDKRAQRKTMQVVILSGAQRSRRIPLDYLRVCSTGLKAWLRRLRCSLDSAWNDGFSYAHSQKLRLRRHIAAPVDGRLI